MTTRKLSKEHKESLRKHLNIPNFKVKENNRHLDQSLDVDLTTSHKYLSVVDEIPYWLAIANDKATFKTKDLYSIFGYKNAAGINAAIIKDMFPKADFIRERGKSMAGTLLWKKKTIIDEIKRRQERNKELEKLKSM